MTSLALRREIVIDKMACRVIAVAAFVALTALGGFVRVPLPFTPVPLTLQTFFVLLSGALLGAGLGGLSQASYMMLGIAGIPLFSSIAGFGYLMGPTGGYILGFLPASILIGQAMKRQNNSLLSIFVLMCVADALLLLCGMLWLKVLSGYSFSKLFVIGFLPFIPGDMIKAAAASVIALKLMPRMRKAL